MRNRVVCYITRESNPGQPELLVFSHLDPGLEEGLQVVAGGVEVGETFEQAALRETLEEAGIKAENPQYLGSFICQIPPELPSRYRVWHQHYIWLKTTHAENAWSHQVTNGEEDAGLVYHHQFVPLSDVELSNTLEQFLPQLKELL